MSAYPSGEQWTISHGGQEATVVEVGGGLRDYRVGGLDVLAGYGVEEQGRAGRGQLLMPWPNRLRDGRYTFDGEDYQLALSEPARGNASHGLVRWALWSVLDRSESAITVGYRLHPQQGWSGRLDLAVTYSLSDEGLSVTTGDNVGRPGLPSAVAPTPTSPSATPAWLTSCSRCRRGAGPRRRRAEAAHRHRTGGGGRPRLPLAEAVGDTRLDTAFTGLERDEPAAGTVDVGGLAGRPTVAVWGDEAFGWVQVFTDKAEDGGRGRPRGRRRADELPGRRVQLR